LTKRRFGLSFVLFLSLLFLLPPLLAQINPPLTCTAQAAGAPTIRAEGVTELVGDVLVTCIGGTPVAFDQPQVNIQVFTSPGINITSRLTGQPGGLSEALLFIDDPAPQNQVFCNPLDLPPPPNCNPISGTYRGNAFQGRLTGGNSLVWLGVPFDPPGTVATRVIRITNVRANASQLGVGSSREAQDLGLIASITSPTLTIQVTNPSALVGTIRPSMNFTVVPTSVPHCEPQNAGLLQGGGSASGNAARLRFTELFPTAFRRRNLAQPTPATTGDVPPTPIAQDVLGSPFSTESGFYKGPNPSGSNWPTTGQPGATLGLADHGTRLIARFTNVQSGIQLWVETSPPIVKEDGGARTGTARLINTSVNGDGPFSPVNSTATFNSQGQQSSIARVPISGGTGQAVWEILNSDPAAIERLDIRALPVFQADGTRAGSPLEGTVRVTGGFAPFEPLGPPKFEIPKAPFFFDVPAPIQAAANEFSAFTLHSCSGDPSRPLNLTGPLQNTLIVNYPLDSSLPRAVNALVESPNGPATVTATPTAQGAPQLGSENEVRSNWLEAIVTQGTTPATVTAGVHPQGLAPGQYTGRIDITSPQAASPRRIDVTLNVTQQGPFFQPGTVFHGASYSAGFLSPGMVTTIFGLRFGPDQLAGLVLGQDGKVTTNIGQTRVLIDGVAAPMIASVRGQVSFFAPFSLAGKTSAAVQVEYQGVRSLTSTLPVVDVAPGLFTLNSQGFGQGAILNQDLSVNGPNNPANRGDVVVLYGSGYGQSNPAGVDGQQAKAPFPAPTQPMKVFIDGKEAIIDYQGAAPSLTEGIFQINARVPTNTTPGEAVPVEVRQGTRVTPPGVTLAVR